MCVHKTLSSIKRTKSRATIASVRPDSPVDLIHQGYELSQEHKSSLDPSCPDFPKLTSLLLGAQMEVVNTLDFQLPLQSHIDFSTHRTLALGVWWMHPVPNRG